jgi:hypothetical protein
MKELGVNEKPTSLGGRVVRLALVLAAFLVIGEVQNLTCCGRVPGAAGVRVL